MKTLPPLCICTLQDPWSPTEKTKLFLWPAEMVKVPLSHFEKPLMHIS
ncbi:hypothetical protein ACH41C_31740 [Streptomyces althioticus]